MLTILRDSGTAAYGFFTSPNRELASLTPIELLIGRVTHQRRELESESAYLLAASEAERCFVVRAAAEAYAADLAA